MYPPFTIAGTAACWMTAVGSAAHKTTSVSLPPSPPPPAVPRQIASTPNNATNNPTQGQMRPDAPKPDVTPVQNSKYGSEHDVGAATATPASPATTMTESHDDHITPSH